MGSRWCCRAIIHTCSPRKLPGQAGASHCSPCYFFLSHEMKGGPMKLARVELGLRATSASRRSGAMCSVAQNWNTVVFAALRLKACISRESIHLSDNSWETGNSVLLLTAFLTWRINVHICGQDWTRTQLALHSVWLGNSFYLPIYCFSSSHFFGSAGKKNCHQHILLWSLFFRHSACFRCISVHTPPWLTFVCVAIQLLSTRQAPVEALAALLIESS